MSARASLLITLLGLSVLGACKDKDGDTGVVANDDPTLEHEAPTAALAEGGTVDLRVAATDRDGVAGVTVFHRVEGSTYWDSTDLDANGGDIWSATVDGLYAPGIEYYFRATDRGAPTAESLLPAGGPNDPFVVPVAPESKPVPWFEDFERTDSENSLFSMGWWTPSDGFNGYPFQLTDNRAAEGETAAYHPRGAAGVGRLDDWLISPALDLTTLPAAMVTWQELGVGLSNLDTHGLYISTTSRDPDEGGFVAVLDTLPAPLDREWGRSKAYDLSQWAGEDTVYLAWKYTGDTADDWYIDDIRVQALAPDLTASVIWLPDPVGPGDQAAITVVLVNETAADATGLTATLTLPDGGGTVVEPTVDVDDIAGEDAGQADFLVDLDPEGPPHRYLPLAVSVTDGDQTWDFALQMTVGLPSTADVGLTLDDAASVNVRVGVGDPDAPTVEVTVWAGLLDAGSHTLTLDVTDWYDLLPPAPGPERWFATVTTDGTGTVDDFTVTYGGESTSATVLPGIFSGTTAVVYAPEPPKPSLLSFSPSSASPGDTDIPVSFVLRNAGDATSGPVTGELVAVDADVSVTSGATFSVDPDVWAGGEIHAISGPLVAIGAAHTTSAPGHFRVDLDDGVESWSVDVEIEVPWPVLKIVGVEIADSGGDGVLDAGESATLTLDVVNTGDLSTFAPVSGTLSVASSSTATADVPVSGGSFGRLSSGASRDDDFEVTVTSGAAGDTLDLVLDLDDGTATYQAEVQIILGEPPWLSLSTTDDRRGDALDGYDWDFVNGRYRVVGTTVELWLESSVAIDPSTLFIEAWGSASGTPYSWYRWVLQSGTGTFQGYTSSGGFNTIGTMNATFPGNNDVILSWDTADMGLISDSFRIGLAAGWCGPPSYYCDHFPDYWGYPYDSFSSSSWFDVRW